MQDHESVGIFEKARPNLLGLAYRLLGTLVDAEDAVQDTFIKWTNIDREKIENHMSWLTTVCTRQCLDLLRSANRSRVNYVGAWLPEPIHTPIQNDAAVGLDLASSLTTAFLVMLERLTPRERAAYLLHEIFEVPYPDIAEALEIKESACRKLVSRAKISIDQARVRHITPLKRQEQFLAAFKTAITDGDTAPLTSLLSDDIRLTADGGGKVPTLLKVLYGKADVTGFLSKQLGQYWSHYQWHKVDINGARGVVVKEDESIIATVSFAYDGEDKATHIYIMRNPDKINTLSAVAIH